MTRKKLWKGNIRELIELAKSNSETVEKLTFNTAKRVYNIIVAKGVEEVTTVGRKKIKVYPYFEKKVFGQSESINRFMNILQGLAASSPIGRPFIIMVGPPGSGKSTIAEILRKAYYGLKGFRIKGCPWNENPLKALSEKDRKALGKELNVRMPIGDLCAWCSKHYSDILENGEGWEQIPAEEYRFSKTQGTAILGTTDNPQDVDLSKLVGAVNTAKMTQLEESDPDAWDTKKGAGFRANNGMLEIREILKLPGEFQKPFSEICQEAEIEIPGIDNFTGFDVLIVGHTNITEYKKFLSRAGDEWLRDRAEIIRIPYVLSFKNEAKIYEKLLGLTNFKGVHLSPDLFEQIARLPVASRLTEDEKCEAMDKVKFYAGEPIKKDLDIKLSDLMEHGRNKGEGMTGISPRTIWNVLRDISLPRVDNCLFVLDFLDDIEEFLKSGEDPTSKDRPPEVNEALVDHISDLRTAIREEIYETVIESRIADYSDEAETMLRNYFEGCVKLVNKEEIGEKTEELMRDIEEEIGISESGKKEWRFKQLSKKGMLPPNEQFDLDRFPELKKGIRQNLIERLKPVIDLVLVDEKSLDKRTKRGREKTGMRRQLIDQGCCKSCAEKYIDVASEERRKES